MKYCILSVFLSIGFLAFSQESEVEPCSQHQRTQILWNKLPHHHDQIQNDIDELEEYTQQYTASHTGQERDEVYIVPVVFHVIHDNGPENIDDEQIYDAMEWLNIHFRAENENLVDVISEFQPIIADIEIEFRLAQLDPDGNCTKGIVRVQSDETYEGGSDMKDLSRWPRNSYLNVWVCADAGGAAGYSYLPGNVNGFWGAEYRWNRVTS